MAPPRSIADHTRNSLSSMTSVEHDRLFKALQQKYILPYAAFRRCPLGGWRVSHWLVMTKEEFALVVNQEHLQEASKGLVVGHNVDPDRVKLRITNLIAEELPLQRLITNELTPVLNTELQNVTCSPTVTKFTCALAHLLSYLLFRQLPAQYSGRQEQRSNSSARSVALDTVGLFHQRVVEHGNHEIIDGARASRPDLPTTESERPSCRSKERAIAEAMRVGGPLRTGPPANASAVGRRSCGVSPSLTPAYQGGGWISSLDVVNGVAHEVPQAGADIGAFSAMLLDSDTHRVACVVVLQQLFAELLSDAAKCFDGAFAISVVVPLAILACKDGVEFCLRGHYPRIFRNRWQLWMLTDRINALITQLFDSNCYLARTSALLRFGVLGSEDAQAASTRSLLYHIDGKYRFHNPATIHQNANETKQTAAVGRKGTALNEEGALTTEFSEERTEAFGSSLARLSHENDHQQVQRDRTFTDMRSSCNKVPWLPQLRQPSCVPATPPFSHSQSSHRLTETSFAGKKRPDSGSEGFENAREATRRIADRKGQKRGTKAQGLLQHGNVLNHESASTPVTLHIGPIATVVAALNIWKLYS
ncbi:hypothetical protein BESB_025450 [Besnoitia besnoiti]|uniref:Uncharacterized protein n=1 Tax=Besnoitia besnoiti TaxID=94643 RepID=A0A2A9M5J0_BESBE|nr:uncharacterized protein BESB_025450 [Besnoitia besnoiti]PFH31571.1 hypothetical protein BESB_025450 [Besnoitia besnoiti]